MIFHCECSVVHQFKIITFSDRRQSQVLLTFRTVQSSSGTILCSKFSHESDFGTNLSPTQTLLGFDNLAVVVVDELLVALLKVSLHVAHDVDRGLNCRVRLLAAPRLVQSEKTRKLRLCRFSFSKDSKSTFPSQEWVKL